MQNSTQKGQNMMVQSSKQLGRENSNRSTTPQKTAQAIATKKGVQYDNYQMAGGAKQGLSH